MKKVLNGTSEADVADRIEHAKKTYRYVSDVARRIDEASANCKSTADLFTTHLEAQRQKLRDHCEKLMFLDPLAYGKKSLELLWRKVYYETVSAAKKFHDAEEEYDNYLFTHIVCGIGHFHHFVSRIIGEMKLHYTGLDFLPLHKDEESDDATSLTIDEDLQQWGRTALHCCLVYLGDLSRYQAEMFRSFDSTTAARYYLQAAKIDVTSGMPFNQLGNLYMDKNHNLDSACYYIHCQSMINPFDGAAGNLTKLFEKNAQHLDSLPTGDAVSFSPSEHVQCAIIRVLNLAEIWYFGKDDQEIPQRCNLTAHDLKVCMDLKKPVLPDINKEYERYVQSLEDEHLNPTYLNSNIIHKVVQICLFSIAKLRDIDEGRAFAAKAFTLALFSQLLHRLLEKLHELGLKNPASKYRNFKKHEIEIIEETVSEEIIFENGHSETNHVDEKENNQEESKVIEVIEEDKKQLNGDSKPGKKAVAKRRRRRRFDSSESSDMSDDEPNGDAEGSCLEDNEENQSDDSYQSDDDSISDLSEHDLSEEDAIILEKKESNGKNDSASIESETKPINGVTNNNRAEITNVSNSKETVLNETEIQNFLRGDNFLPTLKLLQDWLMTEKDLTLSCGDSGEPLFQCVVDLLNIFESYFKVKKPNGTIIKSCKILDYAKSIVPKLSLEYKKIPLAEDLNLRGTNICKYDENASEWEVMKRYNLSVYDENVIRILNFIEFGREIAKIVPAVRYNRSMQIFFLKKSQNSKNNAKANHKRSKEWHLNKKAQGAESSGLLRRLGRLWLASRVRELERTSRAAPPALLVLDAAALTRHMHLVRQLLRSKTFLLLVPTIVLQEMDELKREQGAARDAIRWLETQLQSGSRFLRTQRPGQARPLPLLKYPRKAPKDVHNYIQILEFCYHFVADDKIHAQGGNGDPENTLQSQDEKKDPKSTPLLILLTGVKAGEVPEEQCKDFSFTGVAQVAGIPVEYIGQFYTKWKQSVQKSGKKR